MIFPTTSQPFAGKTVRYRCSMVGCLWEGTEPRQAKDSAATLECPRCGHWVGQLLTIDPEEP